MKREHMENEEKDIRFVARFYREDRLDTTRAWQKLGIGKRKDRHTLFYKLTAMAAAVCLVAGLGWWWMYDKQDWVAIASSAHAVREITLPDDSRVTLAEGSELRYDRRAYGKGSRSVRLSGKAFFTVTHRVSCPFKVQTPLADVQVLGTRFQVTADAERTSAGVESGKVRFYSKEQKEAVLTKGMHASIDRKGQMRIDRRGNPNAFAWKTRVFVYSETPLDTVVKDLEEVYKVRIGGLPREEHYLTASFDHTPIEEIIEIINQTLDTKLDITK